MSSVSISGDVSGAISIAAPSAAGSGTLTLPVATDTLVGKATTDTLTNKTLTSPVINGFTGDTSVINIGSGQVYKDASGNVGVGITSTNSQRLLIKQAGSNENGFAIQAFANDGWFRAGHNGTTAFIQSTYSATAGYTPLTFYTSDIERMRIDSSGALLVGATANVNYRKTLVAYNDTLNNGFGINETTGASGAQFQAFFSNGTSCGTIIRVGATSAVTYGTSSDYRLKKNILPMVGALEKVLALKPCTYTWKDCDIDSQGFIAHELAEVCPDAVQGEKDATSEEEYEVTPAVPAVVDADGVETTPAVQAVKGTRTVPSYQGIDTSFLVATLTAAIQELKAIVDAQAVRIAALES